MDVISRARLASFARALCACVLIQLAPVASATVYAGAPSAASCELAAPAARTAGAGERSTQRAPRSPRGRAVTPPNFHRAQRPPLPPRSIRIPRIASKRLYLKLLSIRC